MLVGIYVYPFLYKTDIALKSISVEDCYMHLF